jgi:hypothetical protein
MRLFTLIITIQLCCFFDSYAQTHWTFKDTVHTFIVTIDTSLEQGQNNEGIVRSIDIFNSRTNEKVQSIVPEEFEHNRILDSNAVFFVEDMNFDGYSDIRLLNWTSISFYTTYWYWFYNPVSKHYERDTTLEKYMNPYFDQELKTFHTFWRVGLQEFGHAIYKWQNGTLELKVEQIETWGIKEGEPGLLTTRKMVDNKIDVDDIEVDENLVFPHDTCNLWKE